MNPARPADQAPSSPLDVLAAAALDRLAGLPGVHRAGLAVSEGGLRQLLFTAVERRSATGSFEWCRIDPGSDVPLIASVRRGEVVAGSLTELEPRFPEFVSRQRPGRAAAIASVPLLDGDGGTLGGLVLYFGEIQVFDEERMVELAGLGRELGERLELARQENRRALPPSAEGLARQPDVRRTHLMAGDLSEIAAARSFLRTALEDWGCASRDLTDDAVLCMDELATNAVVHAHFGCRIEVAIERGVLSVRVFDHGSLGPISMLPEDEPITAFGRGLLIVEDLATRWGRDADRCLSWFEIDLPGTRDREE